MPHLWTTATLALLLKAGKNGSEPKHFRPIGLLDALGKSCVSMVLCKIKSDLEAFVRTAPQFSYIAGHSKLCESHARNPHQRFAGLRVPAFQGGVQVCLDLASAFASVPHVLVREALREAGVEEGPASLLFAWLSSCPYDLHLSGLRASITARRGVKQALRCSLPRVLSCSFVGLISAWVAPGPPSTLRCLLTTYIWHRCSGLSRSLNVSVSGSGWSSHHSPRQSPGTAHIHGLKNAAGAAAFCQAASPTSGG